MPQKPETKFQKKVTDILDKIPDLWYFKAQLVARRGIPDLIICYRGWFVAWELKTDVGVASALQLHNIRKIDIASGIARVVTPSNIDIALKELYGLTRRNHTHPATETRPASRGTACTCKAAIVGDKCSCP